MFQTFCTRHDKKTVSWKYEPGDKILLLPIPGKPLQARYFGPCVVKERKSENNCVVVTPDRCKDKELCHINMLKPYFERNSQVKTHLVNAVSLHPREENDVCEHSSLSDTSKVKNPDILKNLDSKLTRLSPSQHRHLKRLIYDLQHLFMDVPIRTNLIFHDVDVGHATPVKHPYRFNPMKQKSLQDEIDYLLKKDFIKSSQSNWSSPYILSPKPDGTYCMCTD